MAGQPQRDGGTTAGLGLPVPVPVREFQQVAGQPDAKRPPGLNWPSAL
nr:hypothetical protein [Frankia sp. CiP3]